MKQTILTSQIFLLIFIISCTGHDKPNLPEDSNIESKTILNEASVERNQANDIKSKIPWLDPLFQIEGQLCQHLRRIFQDKSGNLWFGTNVYGVMRYNGDSLEYFSINEGFGGTAVRGIVEDKEGNVWFGTGGGLTKYDGESFTNFTEKDGLINNDIWSLTIDSKGKFWIGTIEGVCQFNGEEFTPFPIPKADVNDTTSILSYNRVSCIMEDRNGTIWFGTDGFGICKYDPSASLRPSGKTFSHITKEDGLCDNNVTHIMEDKKGNIWIGTMYGGISRYDGKTFTNFTENGVVNGIEVWSIYEDKTGNIWFPAENFGVYRYDGKSFTNFQKKEGLVSHAIQCIFEDKEGRLWFGGWLGLFLYDGISFLSVTKKGPWQKC